MNSWKKANSWTNTSLYQASNGIKTTNVEITTIKDKRGYLKRVECSKMSMFESYDMATIKEKVFNYMNTN